jgi:hypothetical protein
MRGGIGLGELHDSRADRGVDVDGVVVAGKFSVKIKCAARARCSDDGDGWAFLFLHPGSSGKRGLTAAFGETGKSDHVRTAAAHIDSGNSGSSGGRVASTAGAGSGRDSRAGVCIGAEAGSGFTRARSCSG